MPGLGFAGTLTFSGTITTLSEPVSSYELLSEGLAPGLTAISGSCAANSTCALSAAVNVLGFAGPLGFPSLFAIVGYYGSGPSYPADFELTAFPPYDLVNNNPDLFIVTSSTFTPSGGGFSADFGSNEDALATHVYHGWGDPGAFVDGIELLTFPGHSSYFMNYSLFGGTISGNLWDYTTGTSNGSVSLTYTYTAAPEPGLAALLAGAMCVLIAVKGRRR
jgi:hypothetical protein